MKPALKILRNRFQNLYSRKSQRQLVVIKNNSEKLWNCVLEFPQQIICRINFGNKSKKLVLVQISTIVLNNRSNLEK